MEGKLCSSFISFICPCLIFISLIVSVCTTSVTCATYSNETDRQALLAFKDSITNSPLGLMASWNNSLHFCEWHGVTCGRRHQRVVALDLSNQRLVGRISSSIGNLSFLRSLQLQDNRFLGNIPQELSLLSRLQFLVLSHNILQGEIPGNLSRCLELKGIEINFNGLIGKIPESLGSLSNLLFLSFYSNHLYGAIPPSLGNLSFIEDIYLAENHLEGTIPDSIGRLNNLIRFNIAENNIFGIVPPSLYNSSSLEELYIPVNQLTGSLPSDIGLTLPNLRRISIGENHWSGQFPVSFSNASNMIVLDLTRSNLDGPVPVDLATRMVDLQRLNFGANNLGTGDAKGLSFLDSLTNCTQLQSLVIAANGFGGVIPNSFTNLSTQLRYVIAEENQFVGNIPDGISNYVNLVEFTLGNNFLSGSIPFSIGKLQRLQLLDLSNNNLSGPIPTSVGNLTQLVELHLERNSLIESIPSSFKNFQGLQILNLSYNNLSGSVPKALGFFSTVVSVNLAHNSFTGLLPSEIGGLNAVHDLDFSNNKFSGEIPSTLGNCLELENLHLENNMLQGSIPPSLGSLKGIVQLDLSCNNLSGAIPIQLEKLSFMRYLNLSFNDLQGEVPSKGIFMNTKATSIVGNKNLCGGIPELHLSACSILESKKLRNHLSLGAIIAIASAVVGLVLIALSIVFWWKRKPRKASSPQTPFGEDFLRVSYDDLLKATERFSSSNLIGVGSFGSVYKGILHPDERPVAVKVFNLEQIEGTKSFIVECEALRKTRHRNLVKIITACSSINFEGDSFKAIVFEFMANGSLESWLHASDDLSFRRRNLNLFKRLNIAIDIAYALNYLHHDCGAPVVHCDLKPSNVLLDDDMTAHVGDFGLARFLASSTSSSSRVPSQSIVVKGSIGYVAPEYGMGTEVSTQGDVYSYGILLLEMVTGKKPTDDMFTDGRSLHNYCKIALSERVLEIVDPSLLLKEEATEATDTEDHVYMKTKIKECLISLLRLGVACSAESPDKRMNAGKVLIELNRIKEVFLGVGIHGARQSRADLGGQHEQKRHVLFLS